MLYLRCPTCGVLLGNKVIEYEEQINKINALLDLSTNERIKKRQELLEKLDVNRYCCKMRMITYVDVVQFIK